jgi:hypothetical protein
MAATQPRPPVKTQMPPTTTPSITAAMAWAKNRRVPMLRTTLPTPFATPAPLQPPLLFMDDAPHSVEVESVDRVAVHVVVVLGVAALDGVHRRDRPSHGIYGVVPISIVANTASVSTPRWCWPNQP